MKDKIFIQELNLEINKKDVLSIDKIMLPNDLMKIIIIYKNNEVFEYILNANEHYNKIIKQIKVQTKELKN